MNELTPWWKKHSCFRDNKAVIKLYKEDGSFLTSVNIPSVYWPLNGKYEVFTYENTFSIADDAKASAIFDSLSYQIGHCYQNTQQLVEAFRKEGYTIKPYCGWAFVNDTTPVHHCWAVLTDADNHNAVLDLSCDSMQMWQWLKEREDQCASDGSVESAKERLVEWVAYSLQNMTHSERCLPAGIIPPTHLYIGSECEPDQGITLYRNLIFHHPGHLCEKNVNSAGYNQTQWLLKLRGLMN